VLISEEFESGLVNKQGPIQEVATPQLLWFSQQAEDPFKAGVPDPFRATWDCTGNKCECSPDANSDRYLQAAQSIVNPDVLLWQPKRNPQNIGAGIIDAVDNGPILFRRHWPERRRERSNNPMPRVFPFHCLGQCRKSLLCVAEEVAGVSIQIGAVKKFSKDLWAGRADSFAMTS
jgi:hypothetical protein